MGHLACEHARSRPACDARVATWCVWLELGRTPYDHAVSRAARRPGA